MNSDQPTLIEPISEPKHPSRDDDAAQSRTVFLTNRQNLLQVLSSGLLAPASTYSKYYDDLLALTPGAVPLLRAPVGADECARVAEPDDETTFPVLVAVAEEAVSAAGDQLVAREIDGSATIVAGALPRDALRTIYFRSSRDLEEHQLREYSNISNERWDMQVLPELFTGSPGEQRVDWLMEHAGGDFELERFQAADAVTGALAAAASAAPADEQLLEAVVSLLNCIDPGKSVAGLLRLSMLDPGSTMKPVGANEILFRASCVVLAGREPMSQWDAEVVLRDVKRTVEGFGPSASAAAEISQSLEKVERIITLRQDFEPFTDKGSDPVKALLLVLLRPEADRLLSWSSEETGASPRVRILAATLAGLAVGRTKLPLSLRSDPLDRRLSALAAHLSRGGAPKELTPLATLDRSSGSWSITAGGDVLVELRPPTQRLIDLFGAGDRSDPRLRRAANELAKRMAWDDCRRVQVRVPTDKTGLISIEHLPDGLLFTFSDASAAVEPDFDRVLERLAAKPPPDSVEAEIRALLL